MKSKTILDSCMSNYQKELSARLTKQVAAEQEYIAILHATRDRLHDQITEAEANHAETIQELIEV